MLHQKRLELAQDFVEDQFILEAILKTYPKAIKHKF